MTSPTITVSCLLPVYNGQAYLAESIQSILDQSLDDFELIIVNDGSTDGSDKIIDDYQKRDKRIRVLSQENAGIVAALNAGLAIARGTFTARMDADDISLPDRFAVQVSYLKEHPDVVLVGGKPITIDANGQTQPASKADFKSPRQQHEQTDLTVFPPIIKTALHPLVMLRTDALKKAGGYSSAYPHAEDYDMYIRISRYGLIHDINVPVLKYRLHGANISMTRTEEQERSAVSSEIIEVNKYLLENKLRQLRLSPATKEGYILLRVFRRNQALKRFDLRQSLQAIVHILKGSFSSSPAITGRLILMWGYNNLRFLRHLLER